MGPNVPVQIKGLVPSNPEIQLHIATRSPDHPITRSPDHPITRFFALCSNAHPLIESLVPFSILTSAVEPTKHENSRVPGKNNPVEIWCGCSAGRNGIESRRS